MDDILTLISRTWNSLISINILPGLNLGYFMLFGIMLTVGGYVIKRFVL